MNAVERLTAEIRLLELQLQHSNERSRTSSQGSFDKPGEVHLSENIDPVINLDLDDDFEVETDVDLSSSADLEVYNDLDNNSSDQSCNSVGSTDPRNTLKSHRRQDNFKHSPKKDKSCCSGILPESGNMTSPVSTSKPIVTRKILYLILEATAFINGVELVRRWLSTERDLVILIPSHTLATLDRKKNGVSATNVQVRECTRLLENILRIQEERNRQMTIDTVNNTETAMVILQRPTELFDSWRDCGTFLTRSVGKSEVSRVTTKYDIARSESSSPVPISATLSSASSSATGNSSSSLGPTPSKSSSLSPKYDRIALIPDNIKPIINAALYRRHCMPPQSIDWQLVTEDPLIALWAGAYGIPTLDLDGAEYARASVRAHNHQQEWEYKIRNSQNNNIQYPLEISEAAAPIQTQEQVLLPARPGCGSLIDTNDVLRRGQGELYTASFTKKPSLNTTNKKKSLKKSGTSGGKRSGNSNINGNGNNNEKSPKASKEKKKLPAKHQHERQQEDQQHSTD